MSSIRVNVGKVTFDEDRKILEEGSITWSKAGSVMQVAFQDEIESNDIPLGEEELIDAWDMFSAGWIACRKEKRK